MENHVSSSMEVRTHTTVLCSTFNPEASIAAVGSRHGITVFKIPPSSEYKVLFTDESVGCVSQIYQYEDTPLFALVCSEPKLGGVSGESHTNASQVSSLGAHLSSETSTELGQHPSSVIQDSTQNRSAVGRNEARERHDIENNSAGNISSVRILRLYDASTRSIMADVHFRSAILSVQCNQRRLAVALASVIQIFEMPSLRRVSEIQTATPRNDRGLLALSRVMLNSFGEWVSYLAFPQSERGAGDVAVLLITEVFGQEGQDHPSGSTQAQSQSSSVKQTKTLPSSRSCSMSQLAVISAHRRPVAALAMTPDGSRIATASTHGTVVKVFAGITPRLLHVLRRGTTAATLNSLRFNVTGALLAAINSNGSLHVFRCSNDGSAGLPPRNNDERGAAAAAPKYAQPVQPSLPAMNFYSSQMGHRSFAKVSLSCVPFLVRSPSAPKPGENESGAVNRRTAASVANSQQARSMAGALPWHVGSMQCALSDNGQLLSVVVPALKLQEQRIGGSSTAAGVVQLHAVDVGIALQQYVLTTNGCNLVNTYAVQ